jgi:phage shock protein A
VTELYISDFAWGYIAAGRPKDDTARRVAVARQHRAEAALHDANEDRQRLWEQLNQVGAYADALIAENAGLKQDSANLRKHVADLIAWGEGLKDRLAEAQRIAEHQALCDDVRRCLVRLQGG